MSEIYREVEIEGVDADLRGYFHVEERRVLVEGAARGDRVDVRLTAKSRHHPLSYGEIIEVHRRGPEFEQPSCRHAAPIRGRCGGCPAMHLRKDFRDEVRRQVLADALENWGQKGTWHPSEGDRGYRNRSNFVAWRRGDGQVILGSYAPRSRDVAAMRDCLVVRPAIESVHRRVEDLLTARSVPCGEVEGGLRWVSMREAGGEVVLELVVRDELAAWIEGVVDELAALEEVVGVGLSVNDEKTNAIRVGPTKMLRGSGVLKERYGRVELEIWPGAFAQLNVEVASKIYEQARQWVGGAEVVWDLYCGIGGLGLNAVVGRSEATLWGLESVDEAVEAARRNGVEAGATAQFDVVDLGDEGALAKLTPPENADTPEAIVVNPPRRGLDEAVLKRLAGDWTAPVLVYMSCNPKSFAEDAGVLQKAGWRLESVEAYDMLPMTGHIELLGHFVR